MTQQCLFGFGHAGEIHCASYPCFASRLELPSCQEVILNSLLVVNGLWLLYPTTPWYCLFIAFYQTAPYIPTFSSILWPFSDGDSQPMSPVFSSASPFLLMSECQFYWGYIPCCMHSPSITLVMLSLWLVWVMSLVCSTFRVASRKQIYLISYCIDAINIST